MSKQNTTSETEKFDLSKTGVLQQHDYGAIMTTVNGLKQVESTSLQGHMLIVTVNLAQVAKDRRDAKMASMVDKVDRIIARRVEKAKQERLMAASAVHAHGSQGF